MNTDASVFGAFFAGYMALSLGYIIIVIVGFWKLFEKANVAGWKAIVPILNVWEMYKIAGINPLFMLLMFVPVANLIIGLYMNYKLVESFGFGFGGFLLFVIFNPIMILYMGFSGQVNYEGTYFES